jgi:hypothetical protein
MAAWLIHQELPKVVAVRLEPRSLFKDIPPWNRRHTGYQNAQRLAAGMRINRLYRANKI